MPITLHTTDGMKLGTYADITSAEFRAAIGSADPAKTLPSLAGARIRAMKAMRKDTTTKAVEAWVYDSEVAEPVYSLVRISRTGVVTYMGVTPRTPASRKAPDFLFPQLGDTATDGTHTGTVVQESTAGLVIRTDSGERIRVQRESISPVA